MDNLIAIPEWLGAAVIGAIVAVLGYVGKLIIESWRSIHDACNARRARLVELQSLLRAAWVSFDIQNNHARRLLTMVQKSHADLVEKEKGYERIFSKTHHTFTPDEKELHSIIRGITVHSLQPINLSLSNWLKNDIYFRAQKPSAGTLGELSKKLADLEAHLLLWHAKYKTWIPDNPEHALVYLADEEKHGVGFPSGIDEVVHNILAGNR